MWYARLAAILATAGIAPALDPHLIDLLPSDAPIVVGFDIERFKGTPSGKELFSLLGK